MEPARSLKHEEARNSLPDDLKSVFDQLVADYKYVATTRHGAPYVSYIVLADLVLAGWRPVDTDAPGTETSIESPNDRA